VITVKARHLCKPPTGTDSRSEGVEAALSGLSSGHLCNQVSSALVTSPPGRVGSQSTSRRKAYRNPLV
jgi:hypothetical protein